MVDIETLEKTDTESLDLSKMDKGDTLPEEKVEEKTEAPAEEKTEAPAEETPEETGEEKDSAKAEGKPDQERDDKGRFKEIKVPKNRFDQERLAKEAAEKRAEELERQLAQVQQRAEVSKDRAEQASLLDEKISELEGQYGKLMIDGDAEKAAEVMKEIRTMHEKGHGVIGMKIIGNGDFTEADDREKSVRFAIAQPEIHAVVIGFKSPAEVDEAIGRINRALAGA